MEGTTQDRRMAIRHTQNSLLYAGVKFSAAGSFAASLVVIYTFGPMTDPALALGWFIFITATYLLRLIVCRQFMVAAAASDRPDKWARRFNVGALSSAIAWASSMWIVFPFDDIPHQLLLILTLGGVAGGALASLPYDRGLNLIFQLIIMLSVEIRLLTLGDPFSIEVALFSLFVFGFLLSCGKQVGKNYFELIWLKQDIQDRSRSVLKTTERMAQIGYWEWDGKAGSIELSDNLAEIWGESDRLMSIKTCFRRLHNDDRQIVRQSFKSVQERDDVVVEFRMQQNGSGEQYRNMRQVIKQAAGLQDEVQLIGTVQDITDIRSAEEKIYSMAYYDGLTGLANRAYFHDYLSTTIEKAANQGQRFSIIYIDLDNFKGVNDSFGHECGDGYLRQFSNHLKSHVRHSDLVARLGGDEFCILVQDIEDIGDSIVTAKRCLEFGEKYIEVGNHRIRPTLSVGISTYPQDGLGSDILVRNADMAMYYVKNNGKQSYAVYNKEMATKSQERMDLESDLKQALGKDEFELWYQPQIDLRSKTISGVEALIRWRHPTRGIVAPDLFITTAERVGIINEIGEWVLKTGCQQLAEWSASGLNTQLAVNISGDHFTAPGFSEFVATTVRNNGLSPEAVEIEITESVSRDPVAHEKICNELREIGVRIAIDDFGTGYSSLSLLGKLPVNTIKIDRSFIMELPDGLSSKLMVKAITDLCLGFGYDIVAEGVETEEQSLFLEKIGIPHVQGYYFSKPVIASQILPMLEQDRPVDFATR